MNRAALLALCLLQSSGAAFAMSPRDAEVDVPSVLGVLQGALARMRGQPSVKTAEDEPLFVERARIGLSPEELGRLMMLAKRAAAGGEPFLELGLLRKHLIAFKGITREGAFAPGEPGSIEFHAKDEGGELHFQVAADGRIFPWVEINNATFALVTGPAQKAIEGELAVWLSRAASLTGY